MPGDGNVDYHAMIIGEAPGRNEDNRAKPFIGEAGQLLDAALTISFVSSLARSEIFVTNVVKCRPPQNAKPTGAQMKACFHYLHKEIAMVDPIAILALGNSAIEVLLGLTGITRRRGKWHRLDRKRTTWVMPTYHPAYVLRQGGHGTEEFQQFCDDVDLFSGKIIAWMGEGHPDDQKLGERR